MNHDDSATTIEPADLLTLLESTLPWIAQVIKDHPADGLGARARLYYRRINAAVEQTQEARRTQRWSCGG